jgi:hypothetical protein
LSCLADAFVVCAGGERRLWHPRNVHQRPPWTFPDAELVEQADRMVATIARETAVVTIGHGQTGANGTGEVEGRDAGTERKRWRTCVRDCRSCPAARSWPRSHLSFVKAHAVLARPLLRIVIGPAMWPSNDMLMSITTFPISPPNLPPRPAPVDSLTGARRILGWRRVVAPVSALRQVSSSSSGVIPERWRRRGESVRTSYSA